MTPMRVRVSKRSVLVFLLLLSVVTTLLGPRASQYLRRPAIAVLSPAGDCGMLLDSWAMGKAHKMAAPDISAEEGRRLREENEELLNRLQSVSAELARQKQKQLEIQHLRELLWGPTSDIPCDLIPARVILGDSLPFGSTRVINAGSMSVGLPVTTRRLATDRSEPLPQRLSALSLPDKLQALSAAFLVGRLTETGPFAARVQLVTDRDFSARCRIVHRPSGGANTALAAQASGVYTARGDGGGMITVADPPVKSTENVAKGDLLVTCEDESLLPARVLIGEVVEVNPARQAGFVNLKVQPSADLDALREVFVVAPPGGEFKVKKN